MREMRSSLETAVSGGGLSSKSISSVRRCEIVLVRHGETDWNVAHRLQGQFIGPSESRLTPRGEDQALQLANHFAGRGEDVAGVTAVYCSDLGRAVATADQIALALGTKAHTHKGLRERHLGDVQGLTDTEAKHKVPGAFEAMRLGKAVPGGGESDAAMQKRVVECVREIANRHPGERVIAVTHGGTLSTLYRAVMAKQVPRVPTNASIHRLLIDTTTRKMNFASWNETSHLRPGGFDADAFEGKYD